MKKVISSVTNDLSTDQRAHKFCKTLTDMGFDVLLVGRKRKNSVELKIRDYKTKRMNLIFESGPLFYAEYNLRLFFFLLFNKADIFLSNDLDTLPANYLASKILKTKLIHDAHEYYTGVPELTKRPKVKAIWKFIERKIYRKIKYFFTVNNSLAEKFNKEYSINVNVIRNAPIYREIRSFDKKTLLSQLGISENKQIVIYQGAVNVDRGLEELIDSMQWVDAVLLIVGGGDIFENLKERVKKTMLEDKVFFAGKIAFEELYKYTSLASLGISAEKETNENYINSLPNKLFDYIHAGIPVLVSALLEMKQIVEKYKVGELLDSHEPPMIAAKINSMLGNSTKLKEYSANCKLAAKDLCWQKEEGTIKEVFASL